jgi:hyperosmotically inducible periplasmic protein
VRILLALIIGIALGAAGLWIFTTTEGRSAARTTGSQIESATRNARDTIEQKVQVLDLRPQDIKEDLAKTGRVVRRKARDAGDAIADATADARTTTAIKAKFLASKELSSLGITVDTTGGIVTLSGRVGSTEEISKAMLIAMETDGVREVISTLQVRPRGTEAAPEPVNVRTQATNGRK